MLIILMGRMLFKLFFMKVKKPTKGFPLEPKKKENFFDYISKFFPRLKRLLKVFILTTKEEKKKKTFFFSRLKNQLGVKF